MALFIKHVILNLIQILYYSAQTILILIIVFFFIGFTRLGYVNSSGQGRAFLILSILLTTAVFFFLPSLSKKPQVRYC